MIRRLHKLANAVSDLKHALTGLLQVGVVSEVDGASARVRVTLPGLEDLPSGWLTCLTWRSQGVRASFNYTRGERVLCLFFPLSDRARGFVLGSFYDDNNPPPQASLDVFSIEFEDGTLLSYDQGTSTGSLKLPGGAPSVTLTPDIVEIQAHLTRLVSDTEIVGSLNVTGASTLLSTLAVQGETTLHNVLNGAMSATFMGSVGAAGYTGPVAGGVAKMDNGAEVSTTLTYQGIEVTTLSHTHIDAEGRPTGSAVP